VDSNARSLAKAISYRLLGSISTALIFFIFSGRLSLSLGAGALDLLFKTGLYFLHERVWNSISFGRAKRPEYEI
jgi:uncharacterized membrane protein